MVEGVAKWVANTAKIDAYLNSLAIPIKEVALDMDNAVQGQGNDYYICCVCTNVVQTPMACNACENLMCKRCMDPWLQANNNTCPNCRANWNEAKVFRQILNVLNNMEFTCPECQEVHKYDDMIKHMQVCRKFSYCPFSKKEFDPPMSLRAYKAHLIDSSSEFISCSNCDAPYTEEYKDHNCMQYLKDQNRKLRATPSQMHYYLACLDANARMVSQSDWPGFETHKGWGKLNSLKTAASSQPDGQSPEWWIKLEWEGMKKAMAVLIQGRGDNCFNEVVYRFYVEYKNEQGVYTPLTEPNKPFETGFTHNWNASAEKRNQIKELLLKPAPACQGIKIVIKKEDCVTYRLRWDVKVQSIAM